MLYTNYLCQDDSPQRTGDLCSNMEFIVDYLRSRDHLPFRNVICVLLSAADFRNKEHLLYNWYNQS